MTSVEILALNGFTRNRYNLYTSKSFFIRKNLWKGDEWELVSRKDKKVLLWHRKIKGIIELMLINYPSFRMPEYVPKVRFKKFLLQNGCKSLPFKSESLDFDIIDKDYFKVNGETIHRKNIRQVLIEQYGFKENK